MRDAVAFRRVKGCTVFAGTFKRMNRREMNREYTQRSNSCNEEEQQAEDHEPENEGDEDRH